ncbi:tRNA pseudouridine(55) synthase TruB [Mollicutes bacterium LVI A0078]|nr:tRNA pseudouridine(55) synthase TruB [Mollicutes bacterium LVI A0075]WOO91822.1 tRNA pseudouridine(55) synthase TruB [Mollicutes bacterium LVI A0078]
MVKSGFLVINKKKGITSFDVVRLAKKKLGTKKIGHTGTLDPQTDGVLVLAIEDATKYIPIISETKQKTYRAKMKFGEHRDTYDVEGTVTKTDDKVIDTETAKAALLSFVGKYDQYPPIYSAKKVNGKRLYDYAREGIEVEIKPSEVEIIDFPYIGEVIDNEIEFEVVVSKGTYIRSLIVDVATKLETVAYMSDLTRTKSDGFSISDAILEEDMTPELIIDFNQYLLGKYPKIEVYGKIEKLARNGFGFRPLEGATYPLLYTTQEGTPIALYQKLNDGATKPLIMIKDRSENN